MKRWWISFLVAVVSIISISACVPHSSVKNVERISGAGYSVSPPEGPGWRLIHDEQDTLVFGKRLDGAQVPYRSFVAVVSTMDTVNETMNAVTAVDFRSAVENFLRSTSSGDRFNILHLDTVPHGLNEEYCASYDLIQEERGNRFAPQLVLEISSRGFMCLDLSRELVVHAFYSERKERSKKSALTERLKQEAEQFLLSVEVDPYHEPGRAI